MFIVMKVTGIQTTHDRMILEACRLRDRSAMIGCGLMGSTLMGSLQNYYCLTDLENCETCNAWYVTLTDFDGMVHDFDGNAQMYLLSKNMKIAVTPLVLTPLVRC